MKRLFPEKSGERRFFVFTHILYQWFMPLGHQATKKNLGGGGVLQYAPTVAALIFLER